MDTYHMRLKTIFEALRDTGIDYDWDQILRDAYALKVKEEGDDGITLDQWMKLPGERLNDGFCTYIANVVGDDYDVDIEHSNDEQHGPEWLEEIGIDRVVSGKNTEHTWWTDRSGKYFDIEARDGVEKPELLPFFQRYLGYLTK